jgi:translation initiation factor IF-1
VIGRFGDELSPNRRIARFANPASCRIVRERNAGNLSKDDLIDMQGTVVAVHSGGLYRVQCDAGHEVLAQLSGRMRRFRIKVVPGDRVTVGVSPYDPVRGIITFRAR